MVGDEDGVVGKRCHRGFSFYSKYSESHVEVIKPNSYLVHVRPSVILNNKDSRIVECEFWQYLGGM